MNLPDDVEKVYLCGSLSGEPDGNRPAFRRAASILRARGLIVVSPVELDEQDGRAEAIHVGHPSRNEIMARDLTIVCDPTVDALCVLPGWEGSQGFADEAAVARMIGKPILTYPTLDPLRESVLAEAERIVNGARSRSYGHPADHADLVARLWGAAFGWDTDAYQVNLAMILFKLARADVGRGRDSLVDIAGYSRTAEAVLAREGAEGFEDLDQPRR